MEATVYCRCAHLAPSANPDRQSALAGLCASGQPFVATADLCELAARRHPLLQSIASDAASIPTRILACEPRAVRSLFRAANASLPHDGIELANLNRQPAGGVTPPLPHDALDPAAPKLSPLRDTAPRVILLRGPIAPDADDAAPANLAILLAALLDRGFTVIRRLRPDDPRPAPPPELITLTLDLSADGTSISAPDHPPAPLLPRAVVPIVESIRAPLPLNRPGLWKPWFPAIDYASCTNCQVCLNFCLFGVFALDDQGQIAVVAPDQCKTDCPACARVCPKEAIIFPKFPAPPINGGQATEPDALPDLADPLSGDLHGLLRRRSALRAQPFSESRTPEIAAADRAHRLRDLLASQLPRPRPHDPQERQGIE